MPAAACAAASTLQLEFRVRLGKGVSTDHRRDELLKLRIGARECFDSDLDTHTSAKLRGAGEVERRARTGGRPICFCLCTCAK
jgi:hypothetical protein